MELKKQLTASEMGQKSAASRKEKFGIKNPTDVSKLMSHIRKGKKLSQFKNK